MKMHLVRQLLSEGIISAEKILNELMVEIYSKSLVRAICKMLCIKFSQNTN